MPTHAALAAIAAAGAIPQLVALLDGNEGSETQEEVAGVTHHTWVADQLRMGMCMSIGSS